MTFPDWITHHNVDVVAVLVLTVVIGWVASEVKAHIDRKHRRNEQSLAARRGITTEKGGFRHA